MSPFAPQKNFGEPQATVTDTKTTSFVVRTKKCHAEARREFDQRGGCRPRLDSVLLRATNVSKFVCLRKFSSMKVEVPLQ